MRKNFCAQLWVYPRPVLIIAMYLSGGHKTVKNILKRGAFTVSMGDAEHAAACDYVWASSPATACPTRWRARAST